MLSASASLPRFSVAGKVYLQRSMPSDRTRSETLWRVCRQRHVYMTASADGTTASTPLRGKLFRLVLPLVPMFLEAAHLGISELKLGFHKRSVLFWNINLFIMWGSKAFLVSSSQLSQNCRPLWAWAEETKLSRLHPSFTKPLSQEGRPRRVTNQCFRPTGLKVSKGITFVYDSRL